jgi:nitrate reductase NapE component
LERGQSPAEAFSIANLVQGNRLGDFSSILDTTGVAWATNQLATVEVERMLNRYSMVIQFLVVVFTLIFAVLVGFVGVGMFQALSLMIQSLA